MAAATVRSEFSVVYIIGSMAIGAAIAGFLHRRQRAAVAVVTGYVDVSSIEFEACLSIVIEQPQVPGDRVVAGLTVVFEHAVVRVIVTMTADAIDGGVSESPRLMTFVTLGIVVRTEQWKAGEIVIE